MTTSRRALVLAALSIVFLQRVVPFGRQILYPLTLLATWVAGRRRGGGAAVTSA